MVLLLFSEKQPAVTSTNSSFAFFSPHQSLPIVVVVVAS